MNLIFADFVLNPDSRLLTRGGAVVPLEPKMFALLEALINRRPAVVTYAELDELLWPKVYVARTSLTRLVSELRNVLGDSSGDSPIIRTVYKTGYAFAAAVRQTDIREVAAAVFTLSVQGRSLPLAHGASVAGRDADCAVVVDSTTV